MVVPAGWNGTPLSHSPGILSCHSSTPLKSYWCDGTLSSSRGHRRMDTDLRCPGALWTELDSTLDFFFFFFFSKVEETLTQC